MKYIFSFLKHLGFYFAFFGVSISFGYFLAAFIYYITEVNRFEYSVLSILVVLGIVYAGYNTLDFYKKNNEDQTTS